MGILFVYLENCFECGFQYCRVHCVLSKHPAFSESTFVNRRAKAAGVTMNRGGTSTSLKRGKIRMAVESILSCSVLRKKGVFKIKISD